MFFSHLTIYSTAKVRQVFGTTKLLEQNVIAHQNNDRAVMAAYGFPVKTMTESQYVAELFELYQELTK